MAEDNVAKIKERLDVVDVVSGYIKTHKAGINYKARCPFHNEKTPSFYISPERQIWHCFGCQKGGDMFTFVQELEGVDFPQALRILAGKAGVELEAFAAKEPSTERPLFDIVERSSKFFEKQLHFSVRGKQALAYLKGRGMTEETIRLFRIGFAPAGWHALSTYMLEQGFQASDVVASGMALKKEGVSDIYDRFRSRITFPIMDAQGRIVGFTARVFGDDHPADVGKYINTPQTAIYDKSRVLYGLHLAKADIRRSNRCLLVEGNIDAIMSYQSGVTNVVASSGTALTPSHLQLLQRYTNTLDFCFDTDQAGSIATRRGIGMALARNFNVSIVHMADPECKDPADYVQKYGTRWAQVATSGRPAVEFYFEKTRTAVNLATVAGKKEIIAVLAPLIKRVTSSVEKAHWVSQLALALKTKEDAVVADLAAAKDDLATYEQSLPAATPSPSSVQSPVIPLNDIEILNQSLLAVILRNPRLLAGRTNAFSEDMLMPEVAHALSRIRAAGASDIRIDELFEGLDDRKNIQIGSAYIKATELLTDMSDQDLEQEFQLIVSRLVQLHRQHTLEAMVADVKEAEAFGDREKLAAATQRIQAFLKQSNAS